MAEDVRLTRSEFMMRYGARRRSIHETVLRELDQFAADAFRQVEEVRRAGDGSVVLSEREMGQFLARLGPVMWDAFFTEAVTVVYAETPRS